ncbi:hypothetical protein ACFPM0_25380 [Pseudonocardia sulfidoxydans]|uniref:hypothetical protein n=1 Tax=Pseudonocardia sulfidoxydans TaxID=54011 RepID=UPI00361DE225
MRREPGLTPTCWRTYPSERLRNRPDGPVSRPRGPDGPDRRRTERSWPGGGGRGAALPARLRRKGCAALSRIRQVGVADGSGGGPAQVAAEGFAVGVRRGLVRMKSSTMAANRTGCSEWGKCPVSSKTSRRLPGNRSCAARV